MGPREHPIEVLSAPRGNTMEATRTLPGNLTDTHGLHTDSAGMNNEHSMDTERPTARLPPDTPRASHAHHTDAPRTLDELSTDTSPTPHAHFVECS